VAVKVAVKVAGTKTRGETRCCFCWNRLSIDTPIAHSSILEPWRLFLFIYTFGGTVHGCSVCSAGRLALILPLRILTKS
jgi:hypothetical protein